VVTVKIALAGSRLNSLECDYTVNLLFSDEWEVRIETLFMLRTPDELMTVDPSVNAERGVVLLTALVGRKVDEAEVSQSGELVLIFEGGSVLTIGPDDDYESWTVAGPAGVKLICQPGGEVAVWSAVPESEQ
jgi:hypothetical protein